MRLSHHEYETFATLTRRLTSQRGEPGDRFLASILPGQSLPGNSVLLGARENYGGKVRRTAEGSKG